MKIPSIKKYSIRKVISPLKEFTMLVVVNNFDPETNLLSVYPISTNVDLATNQTLVIKMNIHFYGAFLEFEFFVTSINYYQILK